MPADKDRIYPGDSYSVKFECLIPTPGGEIGRYDAIVPESAEVKVIDTLTEEWLELGGIGSGITSVPAQINANVVEYTLPGEFTNYEEATDLLMFVTAVFADGVRRTQPNKFSVLEYR